jgi:hypothetical protein
MLGPLTRFLLSHLLTPFWLLVTSPPLLFYVWIVCPHVQSGAGLLGLLLALAWILGCWWLGETTARHMAEDSDLFLPALRHTLRDLRLRLACLPIVGKWFDSTSEQHDDEARD